MHWYSAAAAHLHPMALAACCYPRFFISPQPASTSLGISCGCCPPRLPRSAASRSRCGRAMAANGGEHSATDGSGASPAPPSLLVFSGGTAFNGVVEELKKVTTRVAHVLPVSDDGGSTAEIVRVLGGPAVGDIRSRCLRLSDESTSEALSVRRLLGHRLPVDPSEAKLEWYEIVEGDHYLWDGVSRPYRETIRAFLVYFHNEILRRSSDMFCFTNGSIGNFFFAGARIFFQSLDATIFLFSRVSQIPAESLVLPVISTNDRLTLGCELWDGTIIRGQNEISHPSNGRPEVVNKDCNSCTALPSRIKRVFYMSSEGSNLLHEVGTWYSFYFDLFMTVRFDQSMQDCYECGLCYGTLLVKYYLVGGKTSNQIQTVDLIKIKNNNNNKKEIAVSALTTTGSSLARSPIPPRCVGTGTACSRFFLLFSNCQSFSSLRTRYDETVCLPPSFCETVHLPPSICETVHLPPSSGVAMNAMDEGQSNGPFFSTDTAACLRCPKHARLGAAGSMPSCRPAGGCSQEP